MVRPTGVAAMFTLHGRIATLTLLPLLIAGAYGIMQRERERSTRQAFDIGIEHMTPAAVTFTRSEGASPQFIDVANEGEDAVSVSLPAHWERGEVRGGPLASVTAEQPMFGYQRWQIPAGLTITFRNARPWGGMNVHNPSGAPLRLKIITVNLEKGTTSRDVHLLSQEPLFVP